MLCQSEGKSLQILHESSDFIALNKPFDLVINSDDPDRSSVYSLLREKRPDLYSDEFEVLLLVAVPKIYRTIHINSREIMYSQPTISP
jgi:23S rRNA-/tRNA-specific pseudouridylate synthase